MLKEGTKTEMAVTPERAEEIFNALAEKGQKATFPPVKIAGQCGIPSTPAAGYNSVQTAVINWNEWPDGMAKNHPEAA